MKGIRYTARPIRMVWVLKQHDHGAVHNAIPSLFAKYVSSHSRATAKAIRCSVVSLIVCKYKNNHIDDDVPHVLQRLMIGGYKSRNHARCSKST